METNMNKQLARQMPLQVQEALRQSTLRSMEIQRQLTEARMQQHLKRTPPLKDQKQSTCLRELLFKFA